PKLLMLQVSRAVAANLVVLSHLDQFESRYAGGALSPFAPYSQIGVDLFSCFRASSWLRWRAATWERFNSFGREQREWQRATRIYPTYWVATLVMLGVAAAMPGTVHESFEPISAILLALRIPPIIGIT